MPLDIRTEIARVRKFYEGDSRQRGFNLLLLGEYGTGKTPMLLTARKPIWIDSFDPRGTVGLKKWIDRGEVMVDTEYEIDDPYEGDKDDFKLVTAFGKWRSNFRKRYSSDFFNHLGTYCIDSSTTFSAAAQHYKMAEAGRAGYTPSRNKDYNPAKMEIQNHLRKCLNLPCDFILTGHLKPITKTIGIRKDGSPIEETRYRYDAIGQAAVFIPLCFSEIYVLVTEESPDGVKRKLLIDSAGEYVARSKLSADGLLNATEEPNIKKILRKVGMNSSDKTLFKNKTEGR